MISGITYLGIVVASSVPPAIAAKARETLPPGEVRSPMPSQGTKSPAPATTPIFRNFRLVNMAYPPLSFYLLSKKEPGPHDSWLRALGLRPLAFSAILYCYAE